MFQVDCPPSRFPQTCKRYSHALQVDDKKVKKLLASSVKSKKKSKPKKKKGGAKDANGSAGLIPALG